MKISDVCEYLNVRFPKELAEDFDQNSIGLTIGSPDIEVTKILFTLDVTKEVVHDAISRGCNLIISHHQFLFAPIHKILYDDEKGEIIKLMIEYNLSLYSMHTNLDVASGGVNDCLAEMLGLSDLKIINDEVKKGNYLRYGNISEMTLEELAQNVKEIFNLNGVRVLGDLDKRIKRVGIVGGSGAHVSDIYTAKSVNCDCYITGEVRLSSSQLASFLGLCMIEVNHGVEKFVFSYLKEELEKTFESRYDYQQEILITKVQTDKMNIM